MPNDRLSDAELAKLSPEEREALTNEDPPPPSAEDEPNSHSSIGGGTLDEEQPNPHSEGEHDGKPDPEKPAAPAADPEKPAAAAPPAAAPDTDPDPGDDFVRPNVGFQYDTSSFDEEGAKTQLKALDQQFRDGEITHEEYNTQRDDIRDAITQHRTLSRLAAETGKQNAVQTWAQTIESFMAKPENAIYKGNEVRWDALDSMVKRLASDPKNSNKSDGWLLREADRRVRESMGLPNPAAPAADPKTAALAASAAGRRPGAPPPSLSSMPEAAPPTDDNEFQHIDNLLDGSPEGQAKFERALAKMSRADQEKYLTGR